jgi:hypothetical protein
MVEPQGGRRNTSIQKTRSFVRRRGIVDAHRRSSRIADDIVAFYLRSRENAQRQQSESSMRAFVFARGEGLELGHQSNAMRGQAKRGA